MLKLVLLIASTFAVTCAAETPASTTVTTTGMVRSTLGMQMPFAQAVHSGYQYSYPYPYPAGYAGVITPAAFHHYGSYYPQEHLGYHQPMMPYYTGRSW